MSLRSFLLAIASLVGVGSASALAGQECHATAFIGAAYRDQLGTDYSVKAEIGAFADGYALPATGELVRAGDGFGDMGCSLPWKRPDADVPWIALVRRGGCSIELKIANAIHQGANGLIIYNNRDALSLQNLRVTRKYQGVISVVFTYKWKGEELTTLLDLGMRIISELSIANPCVTINHDHERNMQLVSISFLCFIVLTISLAWLIFYYVQRYRDLQAKERKSRGYSEADEKALKAIPVKTLKSNDKLVKDESECCAVCIDPYKPSEVVRSLVCGHEFHKECIDPWLLENRTCPMCKKDILRHYGSVFLGSQESIIQVVADETQRLAGPSSPTIQVVIVGNMSRSPTPDPELQILTERVQPVNTDVGCFAGSSSSFLTVDSSREVFVDSSIRSECADSAYQSEYAESAHRLDCTCWSENTAQALRTDCSTDRLELDCSARQPDQIDSKSQSAESAHQPDHVDSILQTSVSDHHSRPVDPAQSDSTDPTTHCETESADPSNSIDSCYPSEFASCQELFESNSDEPSESLETQPMCVDENDNPLTSSEDETTSSVEKDGLLEKSHIDETTEHENCS